MILYQGYISSCSKWKGDKRAVHCVCCHSNGELLLSAGRSIKLWNLSDHTLIKVAAPPPDSCTHGLLFLFSLSSFPGSLPPPVHFFFPLSFLSPPTHSSSPSLTPQTEIHRSCNSGWADDVSQRVIVSLVCTK